MRLSTIASTVALVLLPAAMSAQASAPAGGATRPAGCRGTNSSSSAFTLVSGSGATTTFPSYPEIDNVQPGSPAEAAGFRSGDIVVAQDGHDLIADPQAPRMAGDTVRFTVRRNGAEVPLTVVLGRWDPPQDSPGVERVCRPLEKATAGS